MINRSMGIVSEVRELSEDLQLLEVVVDEKACQAYAFPRECGELKVGDSVILNTTAVDLGLGSGGYHFVMGRCPTEPVIRDKHDFPGHIMKLRYTPFQLKVWAIEEEGSPGHEALKTAESLEKIPVIGGSLHSMLVPCVCGLKAVRPELKIAYVMTDGGALPLFLSEAVRSLQKKGLLCGTITVGNSYGGDLEAVNLFSGLLAAKELLKAEVIIVLMGPGVVGTNTKWGTTALELGQIINAVQTLDGKSYSIPRLSFAEQRERHYGISHHTITALNHVSLASTMLVLPELNKTKKEYLLNQLQLLDPEKCQLVWGHGQRGIRFAQEMGLVLSSMGKKYEDDPAFFLAAAATGEVTAEDTVDDTLKILK